MQLNLVPHPSTPPSGQPLEVWAKVDYIASLSATATANIWFGVSAPAARFAIPDAAESVRTDELWQSTCFEAFLRAGDDDGYREWNFAPSTQWAAYDFTGYRDGRSDAETAPPYVRMEDNFTWWALGATIAVDAERLWHLGVSAVLEQSDGTKSYWALAHPSDKPDFHHPDCFTARLA